MTDAAATAALLVDRLRCRGVAVSTRQSIQFVEGLSLTGGTHFRAVAVATLACSRADVDTIDAVLGLLADRPDEQGSRPPTTEVVTALAAEAGPIDQPSAERRRAGARAAFSATEVLRTRDLAECTPDELAQIRSWAEGFSLAGSLRRTRRYRRSARRGRFDVRATVRAAARHHGEIVHLHRRTRRVTSRRVVVLLDVSGSMEPYTRTLLHLVRVGAAGSVPVEVFALGTRLTRLTGYLGAHDADAAVASAVRAVPDWGGGTRLGETLRRLNDDPLNRSLVRGADVVVLSDGLDRGDTELLDRQLARLRRLAHRLVWMNPLRSTPGFEPTAAGMRAAVPHLDAFVDGHSLAAFEELTVLVRDGRRAAR